MAGYLQKPRARSFLHLLLCRVQESTFTCKERNEGLAFVAKILTWVASIGADMDEEPLAIETAVCGKNNVKLMNELGGCTSPYFV